MQALLTKETAHSTDITKADLIDQLNQLGNELSQEQFNRLYPVLCQYPDIASDYGYSQHDLARLWAGLPVVKPLSQEYRQACETGVEALKVKHALLREQALALHNKINAWNTIYKGFGKPFEMIYIQRSDASKKLVSQLEAAELQAGVKLAELNKAKAFCYWVDWSK